MKYKPFFSVPVINIITKYVKSEQNSVSPNSLFVLSNPQTKSSFMVLTSLPYKDYIIFWLMGALFIGVL